MKHPPRKLVQTFVSEISPFYQCLNLHIPPNFPPNMALRGPAPLFFTDSICADKNGQMFLSHKKKKERKKKEKKKQLLGKRNQVMGESE